MRANPCDTPRARLPDGPKGKHMTATTTCPINSDASTAPRRLFFCRTPLQALIVQWIQQRSPGRDTILYYPHSNSVKHLHYAKRLRGELCFVPFAYPLNSHFVSEVYALMRIPRRVMFGVYDELYAASIGEFCFSMLAGWNRRALINTFDDGTGNICADAYSVGVANEGPAHFRYFKAALFGRTNHEILTTAVAHYTIYDPELNIFHARQFVRLDLFPAPTVSARLDERPVVVVLGTPIHIVAPHKTEAYRAFVKSLKPDIFLPHPAEHAEPELAEAFRDDGEIARIAKECIAEEVIGAVAARGYKVIVHGFGSTALGNVRDFAEVKNYHVVPPRPGASAYYERVGDAVGLD